jgi:hypothetical protein
MNREVIEPGEFRQTWDRYTRYAPDWDEFPHVHRKRERALRGRFADQAGFEVADITDDAVVTEALESMQARLLHWRLKARIAQRGDNKGFSAALSRGRVGVANRMRRRRRLGERHQQTVPDEIEAVVTDPWDRIDFNPSEVAGPSQLFNAIMAILVDPARITPQLLINLDMAHEIAPRGLSAEEKLRHYANPRLLMAVKSRLGQLAPLRIPGEDDLEPHELSTLRLLESKGSLFITQRNGGDRDFKRLHRIDLNAAVRRAQHIADSYSAEKVMIDDMMTELSRVRDDAPLAWKERFTANPKGAQAELDALAERLLKPLSGLQHVTNKKKRDLAKQVRASLTFQDKLGRYNTPAISARLTKAIRLAESRLNDIPRIQPHIEQDRSRLEIVLNAHEQPLRRFVEQVERWGEDLAILKYDEPLSAPARQKIRQNLTSLRRELQSDLTFEPYRSFAQVMDRYIDRILGGLDSLEASPTDAQTSLGFTERSTQRRMAVNFMTLFTLAKLKRGHTQLDELYNKLSLQSENLHPEDLYRELEGIVTGLKRSIAASALADDPTQAEAARAGGDIAPELETPATYEAYVGVYELIEDLQRQLLVMCGDADAVGWPPVGTVPQPRDRQKTYRSMKDTLRDFSFQSLLAQVSE